MATNEQDTNRPEPTPAKHRRWWPVIVTLAVVVLAVIAVVLALAPTFISTPRARHYLLSLVNRQLRGRVQVDNVSTSWSGPTHLRGVRLTDPDGRKVLEAREVSWSRGLWGVVRSRMHFDEIKLNSPHAVLYFNDEGKVSLAQAVESPSATTQPATTHPAKLPQPVGRLVVEGGDVRLVRADGEAIDIPALAGTVNFDTLNHIQGSVKLTLAKDSQVSSDFNVRQLVHDNQFTPTDAQGTVKLQTTGGVEIGPLAAFAADKRTVGGRLDVNLDANLGAGQTKVDFTSSVKGLRAGRSGRERVRPIDIDVRGRLRRTGDNLTAQTTASSPAGQIESHLTYVNTKRSSDLSNDKVMALILNGERHALPDFTLDARGKLDIPTLGKAIPALLTLRPGVEIVSGNFLINDVRIRGGDHPSAVGAIELTDLSARSPRRQIALSPIITKFDMNIEPGTGLVIRQGSLRSDFAVVQAQGTIRNLDSEFRARLARLNEFGEVFDLFAMDMTGEIEGKARLAKPRPDRLDTVLDMSARGFMYRTTQGVIQIRQSRVAWNGYLDLAHNKVQRAVIERANVNLDDHLRATATGSYDAPQDRLTGRITLDRTNIGYMAAQAQALGAKGLSTYDGDLNSQVSVDRDSGTSPYVLSGSAKVQNLSANGNPLTNRDIVLRISRAKVGTGPTRVDTASLDSDFATVTARDILIGQASRLSGSVKARADLSQTFQVIGPLAGWVRPPDVAGEAAVTANLSSRQDALAIVADGQVSGLQIGTGRTAFREDRVGFSTSDTLDTSQELLTVDALKVSSSTLSLQARGTIDRYRTQRLANLSGQYQGAWDQLSGLLHQYAPQVAQTVNLSGRLSDRFSIRGPLSNPVFPRLDAKAGLNWASARLYGVALGQAALALAVQKGRLYLPTEPIPASDGLIHLGGYIDFLTQPATLRVPDNVRVLDNIRIDPEIGKQLLSHINPILGEVDQLDGRAGLSIWGVNVPLSEAFHTTGGGQGHLDLTQVSLKPSGVLGELLKISTLGVSKIYAVTMNGVDFTINNGRISYENFRMAFLADQYDMIFSGSVDLYDDTVKLVVSLPVTPGILQRFGLRYLVPLTPAQLLLRGVRIIIPLSGTRTHLMVDLSPEAMRQVIRQSLRGIILEPGRELDQLFRPFERRPGESSERPLDSLLPWRQAPSTEPGPVEKREERLLDLFRRDRQQ